MADWIFEYNKDDKGLSRSTPNLNTEQLEKELDKLSRKQYTFDEEQLNIKTKQNPMIEKDYPTGLPRLKNYEELEDEPNHTVDVSKESRNNLNDMIEYTTRTIGKTKTQDGEDGCYNHTPFPWTKDWEKEEQTFARAIDVRLKNGETYIYEFDNIGELCLCELEEDKNSIFNHIGKLLNGNHWIELKNIGFEYSLVRVSDIVEVKVRYEEV